MKIIHLADLHIGKKLGEHDLYENQQSIFHQIINIITAEKPDAVVIAGDIFDKQVPSISASYLANIFFSELAEKCRNIMIISGNHDSAERLFFMRGLLREGIYLAPTVDGKEERLLNRVTLTDQYGPVEFYLLPFITLAEATADMQKCEKNHSVTSYQEAVSYLLNLPQLDPSRRNVLVAHQFVTGGTVSGSEELTIGGIDNIEAASLAAFDYVALGHLHRPQAIPGFPQIRYCGSPLKYSLAEVDHEKSVTVVELGAKGDLKTREIPLKPAIDLKIVSGKFQEIIDAATLSEKKDPNYVYYRLTDTEMQPHAAATLKVISPNFLGLEYCNLTTANAIKLDSPVLTDKTPLDLIGDFFSKVTGSPLTAEEQEIVTTIATKIWAEEEE